MRTHEGSTLQKLDFDSLPNWSIETNGAGFVRSTEQEQCERQRNCSPKRADGFEVMKLKTKSSTQEIPKDTKNANILCYSNRF